MSETAVLENIDLDKMDAEIDNQLKLNISIAIKTEVLQTIVGEVERAVGKKVVQDIYKTIYFEFEENKIIARAANSDFITQAVVLQNEEQTNFKITEGVPGSICFPADKLISIVKKLKAKNSSIDVISNVATIKSGRPKFSLNGIDGSEFPHTPNLGDSMASISINPHVLSEMYNKTIYAASAQESRPVLTGVHHKITENKMTCVSTDAHRLGQFSYELEGEHNNIETTIPVTVLNEAKKHLDSTDKDVVIHLYDGRVVYEIGNVTLYGRVLEGNYPDTSRLIFNSSQAGSTFTVNAGNFKNLLNNSTVYNPDQPIIIRIKPETNKLRVNTREAEVGEFQEDLAITDGTGTDVVLGVNVRYLQEAFSRYSNDDYIQFEFLPSGSKPAGMQPFKARLKNGNPDCLELFVPVRTDQVDYNAPVVIDNFQGVPEFEFNPFESDFEEVN